MNRFLLVPLLSLVALDGLAAPIYLKCNTASVDEKQTFAVALDEATRKVTHTHENGAAFNAEGFFSVDKIKYKAVDLLDRGNVTMTRQYEIDRTTLAIVHTLHAGPTEEQYRALVPPVTSSYKGTCTVVKAAKRKI
jgi:hypothetical protein